MAAPLKSTEAVVNDLLKYLDGSPGPAEVLKATQYADWKALCQRVSGNWNTVQNVVTTLRNSVLPWCDIWDCKAGDLMAELMMAMQPSQLYVFESKSRGPKLAGTLARVAHKQLSSPRPAEQMSSAQLMLKLGRYSTNFAKEVASMPALVARVGALVLQRGDASTALIAVMDQWVADYKARPALISTLSSLLLDSSSTEPQAAQDSRHDLTDRVTACHILDKILRAQSSNVKVAAGKLALEATARLVQGVLMLLHDMQAAHTPTVPEQAATDPSTVGPSKTKMRLKKPKFKTNSTKTTATMPAPAPQAPAPQPPQAPAASTLKAGATAQVTMAAVAAAAAALASQPAAAAGAVGNPLDAAPQDRPSSPVQAPAAAPAAMDSATAATAPVADPDALALAHIPPATVPAPTAAAAAPVAGGPAQALQDAPHSSVASLPVPLLVPVISTFMRLTSHDPGYVTEQLISNPGDLHTLVHLLEPSAEQLQCRQQAAATVLACLTWALAPHRHKHPFLELYLSSPQALASTGHILQLVPPAEGLHAISALLQTASQDSSTRNRSTRRKPNNTNPSTKPGAGPSTGSGSNSTGSGAASLAAAPALLSTLLQLLQKPAYAGTSTSALNLLYPSCTPAQQLQLAQDPACVEALTQLLSMPKNSPVEPIAAAAAAQMLLQLLKTHTDAVLQASPCTETLVSRLLSAVCPGAAAVHAADALSTLAGSPTGAACLSAPSAIEQLFKLTTAAQDAGNWQPLHKSLAGQYKASLSRIPLIVCKVAVSTPGTLSKLQGCSPTASSVLAAALHLHYSNALPTAAVGLGKKWPALKQELKRLEEQRQRWQEWQQQQREQQEAQLLKGLQLPEGAPATQGDVSFGRWAPESPRASDMDDTAASPQPSRTASTRSDRMSTDSGSGLGDAGAEQRGPAALFPAAAQTEEPKQQGRLRGRNNNSTVQQQQEQGSRQQQVQEQRKNTTDSEMQQATDGQNKHAAEAPVLMPPQAAPAAAAAAVKQPPSSPKRSAAGRAPEPPAKLPAAAAAAGNGPCPDLHAAAVLHRQQQQSEGGVDCKSPVLNPAWLPMLEQQPVTARTARRHARRHQQQQALAAAATPTEEQAPTQEQQQDAAANGMAESMGPSADKPGKPPQHTAAQAKGPAAASQPNPDYMAMHKASTSSSIQQQVRKLLSCQAPAAGIAPAKAVLQAACASSSSSSSKITYTQLQGPKALPKGLKRHWQNDICCVATSIDGATWGYGWGPDAEAAEAAAAEAAVGNMYVSGVSFEGLPPYTGRPAEPEKPQGRSLSAALAAIGK